MSWTGSQVISDLRDECGLAQLAQEWIVGAMKREKPVVRRALRKLVEGMALWRESAGFIDEHCRQGGANGILVVSAC